MEDLKRCPFCGCLPQCGVDFYESHGSEVKLAAIVECTGCGSYKRKVFKATEDIIHVPFITYENAFNDVVAMWNKRVGEADDAD